MADILDRIDSFLSNVKTTQDLRFVDREIAEESIRLIIEEVEEDEVLLSAILEQIKRDWGPSNISLLENFYKILNFYSVFEEDGKRKTVLEAKGKTIVRKFVTLENKQKIADLIK